jgi:NADH:quinone reductase (non-electrogenic)
MLHPLVAGSRGNQALETGEIEAGLVCGGQVSGLIDDVPSCQDLIQRILGECRMSLVASQSYFA